ncbi:unnamed protein product, partial [Rotaria sp. Silwood2]
TTTVPNIPLNAQWTQNAVTVIGAHDQGSALNQLNSPRGLLIVYDDDDDSTIVIADIGNYRIMKWILGNVDGEVVAGGKGQGHRLDQLGAETHVLIDKKTDSYIICDLKNRRVLRWSRRKGTKEGETLIDNISCLGMAMDSEGRLYVSDIDNREVRRYETGDKIGTLVAGGHGAGYDLNQILSPYFIFVDQQQNLYVADNGNHRVMKCGKDAKEGIAVAGGDGIGNSLSQLRYPNGIFVDTMGTVYVADDLNHRVMRWAQGAKQGTVIVGGNDRGQGANQLNGVTGLFFDRRGNLYVGDRNNNRVQRFSLQGRSDCSYACPCVMWL